MKHITLDFTALLLIFSLFLPQSQSALAARAADDFDPQPNGRVEAFAVQPDGKILLGGHFTTLDGQPRNYIGRLNADGSLDTTFNPGASSQVYDITVQPNGKILLGGNFSSLAGQYHRFIGRLNPDGSLDTGFNPETNGTVEALSVQPDGKILVGGIFTTLNGQPRNYIGRLNADGSLDTTFNPNPSNWVYTLSIQPDGKILVGGIFTMLNGQTRNYIGRLNADGTLDTAFNPGANAAITAIHVQPDGKILLAGGFTSLGGQTRNKVGRLNADGALDSTFNSGLGTNGLVWSMLVRTDGKIWLGGSFTYLGGQALQLIGRLNPDGSLDSTFNLDGDGVVYGLGLQPDGRLLLGGDFTTPDGIPTHFFTQLAADSPALQALTVDPHGTTITWMRSGSGPEVERVTFEQSLDAGPYSLLGTGAHVTGGWQLTGLNLPDNPTLSIRARGYYSGGNENGSTSVVESVLYNIVLDPQQTGPIFMVNTTADHDDGACSNADCTLREAIIAANTHANSTSPDEIHFNISTGCSAATGVCTIAPISALPIITQAVIIDGYTQPGASANTLTAGSNAHLLIELNGANAPDGTDGLTFQDGSSTVRGLVINRFRGYGILNSSPNSTIIGNFIGTDAAGTVALGNISGGIYASGITVIGGITPEARNLISGNWCKGIWLSNSASQVLGNYIGTDSTGTLSLGRQGDGIQVNNTANVTIGGPLPGARNLISGNDFNGVLIFGRATQATIVQGNFIGTDISGTLKIGNGRDGVLITDSSGNKIGGTDPGTGNLISGNVGYGINIMGNTATGNMVLGNAIFDNGDRGIDLRPDDPGPNHMQAYPLLNSFSDGVLGGMLNSTANTTYRVEFFANTTCDPSAHGEGEQFLGAQDVTTNGSGQAVFTAVYPSIDGKPYLTASATNLVTGDSSAFSPCLPYVATTTLLVAPGDASTYGESVTLTATVRIRILDSLIPSGLVQFKDGSAYLGEPVALDNQGMASLTTSALTAGSHTLVAEFLQNAVYPGSDSSLTFKVNPKTITVTGIRANDKVYDGTTGAELDLSGAALAGVIPGDTVSLESASVQSAFGDQNTGSSKTVTISGLTLSGADAGNYTLNQPVATASITPRPLTLTAADQHKVYGEAVPNLTTIYSGFAPGETPAVLTHAPELTTTATRTSPPASYPITIIPGSPSALNYTFVLVDGALTVDKASTSLQLLTSANTAPAQQPVSFTAVVAVVPPGEGVLGGTIRFMEGETVLGTAALNPGGAGSAEAVFTIDTLAPGLHTITAAFAGDDNYLGSSDSASLTVATADLSIAIQASANPALAGSSLTLTLTSSNLGPSTATDTVLRASLPAGLTILSASFGEGTPCSLTGNQITCELGDLAAAASQTVVIRLNVPRDASGTYRVSASLNSTTGDPLGEKTATLDLTIQPRRFLFIPLVSR